MQRFVVSFLRVLSQMIMARDSSSKKGGTCLSSCNFFLYLLPAEVICLIFYIICCRGLCVLLQVLIVSKHMEIELPCDGSILIILFLWILCSSVWNLLTSLLKHRWRNVGMHDATSCAEQHIIFLQVLIVSLAAEEELSWNFLRFSSCCSYCAARVRFVACFLKFARERNYLVDAGHS